MNIKTLKGKLVSSKLKKYDHKTGEYYFVEDQDQLDRIGTVSTLTYSAEKGLPNKLHNMDDAAMQTGRNKSYYINGIQYSKDSWTQLKQVDKLEDLVDRSSY